MNGETNEGGLDEDSGMLRHLVFRLGINGNNGSGAGFKSTADRNSTKNRASEFCLSSTQLSRDFYTANETDKGCEYLRVYRVRRPYVNSDVTVRSGYTVCVPSWKTQVRSAVQTQSGPSIGK